MVTPTCPRCQAEVSLHEGRPAVTASGSVELWHFACWDARDVPLAAAAAPSPGDAAPRRRWRDRPVPPWLANGRVRVGAGIAAVALTGACLAVAMHDDGVAAPALAPQLASVSREPLAIRGALSTREDPPPRASHSWKPVTDSDEIPLIDGKPLDELFPSLRGWIHPVTASAEYMPVDSPRLFGAERAGIERTECGAGHCGVDLDGPRGRPIVAVAAGTAVRVERSERGADGRSGRFVRIQHADGTFTAYMHLDEVADGIDVGTVITQGQYVGTLGATATYSSPPHLHFSLEIPREGAQSFRGDHTVTTYINPAPFLMRSKIVPVVERPNRPALN